MLSLEMPEFTGQPAGSNESGRLYYKETVYIRFDNNEHIEDKVRL